MTRLGSRLAALRPEDEGALLRALLWLLGAGFVVRLALAMTTDGSIADLNAFRGTHAAVQNDLFGFYALANPDEGRFAWPYLPGYIPVVEITYRAADVLGIGFERLIRLPQIGADLAIALLVQWHLGWHGASPAKRLAAAALVIASPAGIALTSMHGQLDPVEWLPVVGAIIAWERLPRARGVMIAGLLVGIGIAIKPPAVLAAPVLLALCTTWRERLTFTAAVAAIPVLVTAPFFLSDAEAVLNLRHYTSIAGQGGLSMIVQPDLAIARFAGTRTVTDFNDLGQIIQDFGPALAVAGGLLIAIVGARRQAPPAVTLSVVILATWVLSGNFLPPYVVWIVPFLVLAGWWRFLIALQVLVLLTLPFKYLPISITESLGLGSRGVFDEWLVVGIYIPAGILIWLLMAWRLGSWLLRPEPPRAVH